MTYSSLPPRTAPLKRSQKSIKRTKYLTRSAKPIAKVNTKRQAKRAKTYGAHLRSAYWKALRLEAFKRDGGLCQCPVCIQGRKDGEADAFELIEVWFDTRGGIHGFDTHHLTYARFSAELLSDVLTMRPSCHRRLEAKTGLRKRFLSLRKTA